MSDTRSESTSRAAAHPMGARRPAEAVADALAAAAAPAATPTAPPAPNVEGASSASATAGLRVHGEAIVYRTVDVGYEVDLGRAAELLASQGVERPRPTRGEAQAIRIANPPVMVGLGSERIEIAGEPQTIEIAARVFDFGAISLSARLKPAAPLRWNAFVALSRAVGACSWTPLFDRARERLLAQIAPAIERPADAMIAEDYVVFRIGRLEDERERRVTPDVLADEDIAWLLVDESRPLSAWARREILSPRFSYFEDDLAVLTWNAALVVEPVAEDRDVQYVLEFANAQLLELRYYDAILDRELPRIYDEIAAARRRFHLLGRRYTRLMSALQERVADATELVERVENSLKVTDDVFLARVYAAALDVFRSKVWRKDIDRKVKIVADTYGMLNAEAQARRSEVLEAIIVLLIVAEIVIATWPR
jgi:hypothetical protein